VHVAIEAIGTAATIETAWEVLRPGGLAVVIGMPRAGEKIPIRAGGLFQERRLAGCVYGGGNPLEEIPRATRSRRSRACSSMSSVASSGSIRWSRRSFRSSAPRPPSTRSLPVRERAT
jgi:threonine dehydrogenase-like Zn-dependent dehydrogenase